MNHLINWKELQHNPLSSLQKTLNKAMSDLFSAGSLMEVPHFLPEKLEGLTISPSVDIINDKKNFKVEFEIPGMGKEDVKVSIGDGMLTIKGEKKISRKDKGKDYLLREISYGNYERSISLPESVDINQAKATFKKGMLWVDIPKKPATAKAFRELKIEEARETIHTK